MVKFKRRELCHKVLMSILIIESSNFIRDNNNIQNDICNLLNINCQGYNYQDKMNLIDNIKKPVDV